jgi:hypothetical protein
LGLRKVGLDQKSNSKICAYGQELKILWFGVSNLNENHLRGAHYILCVDIFSMVVHFRKMEFVCESYSPSKITIQLIPTGPSGNHVSSPQFTYVELVTCGNLLSTSISIMEIPI